MKKERHPVPSRLRTRPLKTTKTRTTIFDLIATLNQVVEKGEEEFIPQIVLHMISSGQLKVESNSEAFTETR